MAGFNNCFFFACSLDVKTCNRGGPGEFHGWESEDNNKCLETVFEVSFSW